VVTHIDRCLSCLSCMTTCPSGVNYMHLVDLARRRIEETHVRPWLDRTLRALLAWLVPHPGRFRLALTAAWFAKPFAKLLPGRLGAMLALAPRALPSRSPIDRPQVFAAEGKRRTRVALLSGCAQQVLAPAINEATVRLLTRHGVEVVVAEGAGCCGSLTHHMGREADALASVQANVAAWTREAEGAGLDAIVINASGCGTTVKDYGFMLRNDPDWAVRAAAGFLVKEVPEGHLCCGSAGTYNLLQPELAGQLRDRKLANIESLAPDAIATGNIGCLTQLAGATTIPMAHSVELLDWATGGPLPSALKHLDLDAARARTREGQAAE
jgi:glycolate oxidase iron-sulfur subunit